MEAMLNSSKISISVHISNKCVFWEWIHLRLYKNRSSPLIQEEMQILLEAQLLNLFRVFIVLLLKRKISYKLLEYTLWYCWLFSLRPFYLDPFRWIESTLESPSGFLISFGSIATFILYLPYKDIIWRVKTKFLGLSFRGRYSLYFLRIHLKITYSETFNFSHHIEWKLILLDLSFANDEIILFLCQMILFMLISLK